MKSLKGERAISPIWGVMALVLIIVYLVLLVLFPALILGVTLVLVGLVVGASAITPYVHSPQAKTGVVVVGIVLIIAGLILSFLGTLDTLSLAITGGL